MQVTKVLIADYANVSREGKLNVMGIFHEIFSANFPAIHPQMQLIIMWEAPRTESGRKKQMEIQMRDIDGKKMFSVAGEFPMPDGPSGRLIKGQHIIGLNMIKFEKPGTYTVHVLVNEEQKGEVSFDVVQLPKSGGVTQ